MNQLKIIKQRMREPLMCAWVVISGMIIALLGLLFWEIVFLHAKTHIFL